MKIGIISGSHRVNSQSEKIALYMQNEIKSHYPLVTPWVCSLAENPLPLWDEGIWEKEEKWEDLLNPIRAELKECEGFIIIAPEWHGQIPSGLKNFFLIFSKLELGHKPALITGVSSGQGGTYPIAELRMSSYKNNRICFIPEHLIIKQCESIFNDDPSQNDERSHPFYLERFHWAFKILMGYSNALKEVRANVEVHSQKFGNGM